MTTYRRSSLFSDECNWKTGDESPPIATSSASINSWTIEWISFLDSVGGTSDAFVLIFRSPLVRSEDADDVLLIGSCSAIEPIEPAVSDAVCSVLGMPLASDLPASDLPARDPAAAAPGAGPPSAPSSSLSLSPLSFPLVSSSSAAASRRFSISICCRFRNQILQLKYSIRVSLFPP